MATEKTVTEVVHSEMGEDGTWKPKHKTVTTVTRTIDYDRDGYVWTPRHRPLPYYPVPTPYPDFSARLRAVDQRINSRKDTDGK